MRLPHLLVPSHPEGTDGDATGPPARAAARHDAAAPAGHPAPAAVHPRARAGGAQGAGGEPAPRGAARREAGGGAHLRPLALRDVGEDIGMHESTISRVTTHKYVETPQGLFELKYFFHSGIASDARSGPPHQP